MGIHVGLVLALGSQKLWEDRSRLLTSDIANFMQKLLKLSIWVIRFKLNFDKQCGPEKKPLCN